MATLIPAFNCCARRMTAGERRFAHRALEKLEDDYLCWYDVPVGPRALHPDFVVLHPRRGLLVLEVKDWKLETIKGADKSSFTLLTDRGQTTVANPLEQARQYAHTITSHLERDPLLLREGGRYDGTLCFPYGYGVVLSNIHRKAFETTDLGEVLDSNRVICQDEMFESVDPEEFQSRLWKMFTVHFSSVLSLPQVDRIRWHLFPEIRIEPTQLALIGETTNDKPAADAIPDLMRVMDLHQEQLARNLGDGHRVIHGVAGSGKTLILGYRCEQLAKIIQKPVLVLCYNRALAAKLTHAVSEKRLTEKVHVRTFHSWCRDQLRLYNVAVPDPGDQFFDALVERVISAVDLGQIPRTQYGAVMIDEGHDFEPEWLRLVTQMVDPNTNSLLLLYDDAQSIYGESTKRKFSFSSVGIQAKGRTTILRLNYRNTAEVLAVAYEFAKEFMTPAEAEEDDVPLVKPESAGRSGPLPTLLQLPTLRAEADYLANELRALNEDGRAWRDMAVIYRSKFIGKEVSDRLTADGVPVEWLGEDQRTHRFKPGDDNVKVLTMHSSKGLEFPVVAIPGLGYMPYGDQAPKEEAKLLYVAMTRAMDRLLMTCHKQTDFVTRIKEAQERIAA